MTEQSAYVLVPREVPLTRGQVALVDECDYARVSTMKAIRLGSFWTEVEAAKAYDAAARKYYGEFAACNFPEVTP